MTKLLPGDWIGTEGRAGWRFWLYPLYEGIKKYARGKYGKGAVTEFTHARLYLGNGYVFEMTMPVGRIESIEAAGLADKFKKGLVRVARFAHDDISAPLLRDEAVAWVGKKYDVGDLLDFGLSGLIGWWNKVIRVFGDKAGRFAVCSTAAAHILQRSGVKFPVPVDTIDPCWPFNQATAKPGYSKDITDTLTLEDFYA